MFNPTSRIQSPPNLIFPQGSQAARILRVLRLIRLIRIVKLYKQYMDAKQRATVKKKFGRPRCLQTSSSLCNSLAQYAPKFCMELAASSGAMLFRSAAAEKPLMRRAMLISCSKHWRTKSDP